MAILQRLRLISQIAPQSWHQDFRCFTRAMSTSRSKGSIRLPMELETATGSKTGLVVHRATQEDTDETFELMVRHFLPVPPLRQINLVDDADEETRRPAWKREQMHQFLSQPYSFIVRDENKIGNPIICANIAFMEERGQTIKEEDASGLPNRSPGWLDKALGKEMQRGVDLVSRYKTDKFFIAKWGMIDPAYSRTGLISHLFKMSAEQAVHDGAEAVKSNTYSEAGFQMTLKLGFEVIREVDLDEFELSNGERPLGSLAAGELSYKARFVACRLPLAFPPVTNRLM